MAEPAHSLPMPSTSGRSLPGLKLVKAPPDSQVGTPVRVFVLVVVVLALLFGVKTFVLGGAEPVPLDAASLAVPHVQAPAAATTPALPATSPAAAIAAAQQAAAGANAREAAPDAAAATADAGATATAAAPAPAPAAAKPAPAPTVDETLPKPLVAALRRNPVVVVSLYAPDSKVAGLARLEAVAGAKLAGAGFVGVDVHVQAQVAPLTGLLGVMSDPTLLVFQRPGKVFVRMDGYVDRDAVAQAVANAKLAP